MRQEGEVYGKAHAEEFVAAHRARIVELISIYPDGRAEELLSELREQFWAQVWTPKAKP